MQLLQSLRQLVDTESVQTASREMNEPLLKLFILGIFSMVSSLSSIAFALFYFFSGHSLAGSVAIGISLFFGAVVYIIRQNEHRPLASALLIGSTALILLYFFIFGGITGTEYMWYYIFPAMALFILGLKRGAWLIVSHLATSLLCLFHPMVNQRYSLNFILIFCLSYIVVFILSFAYEYVRSAMRRRFTHSLDQLEKTVKANRAKNDFITDLSQQIRTPLNNISGIVGVLKSEKVISPEKKDMLDAMETSVDSLVKAVSNIVQVAEVRFDTLKGNVISFSVPQLLDRICLNIQTRHSKQLKLSCEVLEKLPPQLTGQPTKLENMFSLFFDNILKAAKPDEAECHITTTTKRETPNAIEIHFELTFIGIKASKISNIGETETVYNYSSNQDLTELKLQKLNINKDEDSLRFDLSEIKKVVESFGGSLGIRINKRITNVWFTVLLWKTETEQHLSAIESEVHTEKSKKLSQARILVVEDNPLNQKVINLALRKQVLDVELASNGKEALDMFSQSQYDLILMDLHMPIMDGYQTVAKIREIEVGSSTKTPIIALTANAMRGTREKCLQADMVDYMTKPFQVEKLLEIIQKHL